MKKIRFIVLLASTIVFMSSNLYAFKFDVWEAGITLREAYTISRYKKKIKLRKSSYTGGPTNPFLSREYDDIILGEPVEVVLFFTPLSKLLCRVYVTWNRNEAAARITSDRLDQMFDELEVYLSKKYAKGSSIIQSSFESRSFCSENAKGFVKQLLIRKTQYTIELSKTSACNWLTLNYQDIKLSKLHDAEVKKVNQSTNSDFKKF